MEIISIEKKMLDTVSHAFEHFVNRMDEICSGHNKKVSKWLDNADVCQILNISKRTLQTYRDNGTLSYSQMSHKMYYKPSDVQKLLKRPING